MILIFSGIRKNNTWEFRPHLSINQSMLVSLIHYLLIMQ